MSPATREGQSAAVVARDMTWRDIPELTALDAELFGHDAWPEATWWAELGQRPRREYVVLVGADGELAAYGGIDVTGESADVMTVAVSPSAQGRGLGGLILAELERRAADRGAEGALLEVRADNTPALRLYERHGWRQVHVRRRYYQPGDVDALILAKRLSEKGAGS